MTCKEQFPSSISSHQHVETILRSLRDYVGIHRVIFDDADNIGDTELVWWNDEYESIRVKPVAYRQSIMATYHEPHIAMSFVRHAWDDGQCHQIFELSEETVDRYRPPETLVRIEVTWIRLGDLILEIGSDLSEMTRLELELIAQREAYSQATRETLLSIERTRISRDLHDSIIQSLFAISLNLRARDDKEWAIESIHQVITEIRSTIFEMMPLSRRPLTESIETIVTLFAGAWLTPPVLTLHIEREIPDDLVLDVENVVKESLSNAARHARATTVTVDVRVTTTRIDVTVRDNGIGPNGKTRRKAGITSLALRATDRGGTYSLTEAEGGGTVMHWACPIA
jgi:signal transduction histidine kinase